MFQNINNYSSEKFKRRTVVSKTVFQQMLSVLDHHEKAKKKKGPPSRFSLEDQLFITLEYWREYRTYFHIAGSWNTHESTVSRIVKRVENLLIVSRKFHLPGKKSLLKDENDLEALVVDATETPVERPQKSKSVVIAARRKAIA